jgi:hypothetical protein
VGKSWTSWTHVGLIDSSNLAVSVSESRAYRRKRRLRNTPRSTPPGR